MLPDDGQKHLIQRAGVDPGADALDVGVRGAGRAAADEVDVQAAAEAGAEVLDGAHDEHAAGEDAGAAGEGVGLLHAVGGQEQGAAGGGGAGEGAPHDALGGGVEARGGLVEQQHGRVAHEGDGQRELALVAARQRGRLAVAQAAQADGAQDGRDVKARCAATVIWSIASNCGHTPRCERASASCRVTEADSTRMSPVGGDGLRSPRMRLMVVDLPAPLGPSRAKTSPCGTPKVTLSTAVLLPKVLVRLMTRRPSVGAVVVAAAGSVAEDLTRTTSLATSKSEMAARSLSRAAGEEGAAAVRLKMRQNEVPALPPSAQTSSKKSKMVWTMR
ncbi:e98e75a7-7cbd-4612-a016-2ec9e6549ee9 [Thermothielavioides terrestris]|uniref:E98e75a7-7cbd-4612-a016-2ec9e6549ee9 n=1 Tax=Thermothielavioides terrestris TaxID=2587410 RepID=A0A446BL87_9PEZI|nr:e98e75a7-7cbd-4612-a016-2ec9e6549ee9 [Thermothielavioides terrestris]